MDYREVEVGSAVKVLGDEEDNIYFVLDKAVSVSISPSVKDGEKSKEYEVSPDLLERTHRFSEGEEVLWDGLKVEIINLFIEEDKAYYRISVGRRILVVEESEVDRYINRDNLSKGDTIEWFRERFTVIDGEEDEQSGEMVYLIKNNRTGVVGITSSDECFSVVQEGE